MKMFRVPGSLFPVRVLCSAGDLGGCSRHPGLNDERRTMKFEVELNMNTNWEERTRKFEREY